MSQSPDLKSGASPPSIPAEQFFAGPRPQTRQDRLRLVDEIVTRLLARYPGRLVAIGLYGSLAKEMDQPYLPRLACHFAERGALMLALAHRVCYSTGPKMLVEALQLPDPPEGYGELCRLVLAGRLEDAGAVAAALERFWAGLPAWAEAHGVEIERRYGWPF
ncbi:MAG: hypothetical protein L0332_26820 [Chloroflexi bacterium]|nr:hypothetical protein [Chloroflexota bacterium]MCI0580837.1 hypothetical protein [Chloroflexota bacterium]MCI0648169.1 hypothetical protein [Chloroflexota bacterium]MCI0730311.1 hypothetical protein [Chloroflexota bacterium]